MRSGQTKYDIFHILNYKNMKERSLSMKRRLIIDGNAVYELDENCMLGKRIDVPPKEEEKKAQDKEFVEEYKKAMKRTE